MTTIQLYVPDEIQQIVSTLASSYEVYYVGGCVRDAILGRKIHDYDCATSATANEMKACLANYKIIPTGIKHGTLTIIHHHHHVEITTFRIDQYYSDHRHPVISFTNSLKEDLKRRDFTINALACDEKMNLIDEHHGLSDLNDHLIRCVGDPMQRFQEDALRIMRAVRLAHQLQFQIEKETHQAILKQAHLLKFISIERKVEELFKMLECPYPNALELLESYSLLEYFGLVYDSKANEMIPQLLDLECRLSCLFQNEAQVHKIMKSWHCSKKLIQRVSFLVQTKNTKLTNDPYTLRKLLFSCNNQTDLVKKSLLIQHLDTDLLDHMVSKHDFFTQLAVNGYDCQHLGISKNQIKTVLADCIDYVLHDLKRNQKDHLIHYIKTRWL